MVSQAQIDAARAELLRMIQGVQLELPIQVAAAPNQKKISLTPSEGAVSR